jgi:N utilization substance protein B
MKPTRRRSREFALQGIYQWIYTGASAQQVLKDLSEMDEFAAADREFLEAELHGTIAEAVPGHDQRGDRARVTIRRHRWS